ncbi:MAG: histidine triad nucleotide-binding protein [Candidatus Cloacimonadota bacterium]|nr:MAG: histidine triad nucleotide-binding protein [Candidatus Cloacimonadota bacterium]PIE78629.1 MAG: histidine triad nucleotide-binding protein [Candidatus Delongbacteria bacterium]
MCVFCKIIEGEIPSDKVYEDNNFLAFRDISPKAKVHTLVIPKKHISDLNQIDSENISYLGKILEIGKIVAEKEGISKSGYRFVFNCGSDAGMEVEHIHLHILGGEKLTF